MRQLIGALLVLFGICFGLYIGIWWGFVGGIIAVVEACKADDIVALDVAMGAFRIVACQFIGFAAGVLPFLAGVALYHD